MLTLGDRIRYLRTTILRKNQASFAIKIRFARVATISDYEKNKRKPDIETLKKIACLGNVTLEWLVTGKGPISASEPAKAVTRSDTDSHGHTEDFVELKVHDIDAAATPGSFMGITANGTILIPRKDWRPGCIAVRIKGESMSPCIMDGAVVGIDKNDRQLVSGELYVVWLKYEGATVKRVFVFPDKIVLKHDNPTFPETTIPAEKLREGHIIGRVIWTYQRFC
jgi:phage repressor protein C with HTH and peptisase S24 domain